MFGDKPHNPTPNTVEAIERFFNREPPVGLHLPSGWFGGRPMDGYHELTLVLQRPGRLIVELDGRILLVFTGDQTSMREEPTNLLGTAEANSLSISDFKQCIVDIHGYGADNADYEVFRSGVVSFVSAS